MATYLTRACVSPLYISYKISRFNCILLLLLMMMTMLLFCLVCTFIFNPLWRKTKLLNSLPKPFPGTNQRHATWIQSLAQGSKRWPWQGLNLGLSSALCHKPCVLMTLRHWWVFNNTRIFDILTVSFHIITSTNLFFAKKLAMFSFRARKNAVNILHRVQLKCTSIFTFSCFCPMKIHFIFWGIKHVDLSGEEYVLTSVILQPKKRPLSSGHVKHEEIIDAILPCHMNEKCHI